MTPLRIVVAVIALSLAAVAQGTTFNTPVTFNPPTGGNTTYMQDIAPATTTSPCLTLTTNPSTIKGAYRLCGQNNGVYVDFGSGYVSLQGQQGVPGQSATVSIGTTTTLPAGSSATVTNSGTPNAAVLNFGIPQGAQGIQGPQGPAGPTWKTCSATITNFSFSGGTATGTLNVTGCQ